MGSNPRPAFTLVETIVVIFILAILIALIIPAIQRVRGSMDSLACRNNLRQIAIALHHYDSVHGQLPPGSYRLLNLEPREALSWMILLSPYYEADNILHDAENACRINKMPNSNPPHTWLSRSHKLMMCPSDSRMTTPFTDPDGFSLGCASYLGVLGSGRHTSAGRINDGLFAEDLRTSGVGFSKCPDGTSNTLLIGERPPPDSGIAGQWYARMWSHVSPTTMIRGPDQLMYAKETPAYGSNCAGPFVYGPGRLDNDCDRYHFWSLHTGGANFAFADASVRFIRYSSSDLLPALASRNGGEQVELEE